DHAQRSNLVVVAARNHATRSRNGRQCRRSQRGQQRQRERERERAQAGEYGCASNEGLHAIVSFRVLPITGCVAFTPTALPMPGGRVYNGADPTPALDEPALRLTARQGRSARAGTRTAHPGWRSAAARWAARRRSRWRAAALRRERARGAAGMPAVVLGSLLGPPLPVVDTELSTSLPTNHLHSIDTSLTHH